jgi:hypothetical protein
MKPVLAAARQSRVYHIILAHGDRLTSLTCACATPARWREPGRASAPSRHGAGRAGSLSAVVVVLGDAQGGSAGVVHVVGGEDAEVKGLACLVNETSFGLGCSNVTNLLNPHHPSDIPRHSCASWTRRPARTRGPRSAEGPRETAIVTVGEPLNTLKHQNE